MTCSVLSEILDVAIVAKIPATGNAHRRSEGSDTESWVWSYLVACLATGVGYDVAREVVMVVMAGRDLEEFLLNVVGG